MTITSPVSRVNVPGNSSATTFSFSPAIITEASDLEVWLLDNLGNQTQLTQGLGPSQYAVSVPAYPGTGSISYPGSGGTTLPTGWTLVMKQRAPLLQEFQPQNQGPFLASTYGAAYDYAMLNAQNLQEQINRAILGAETDPDTPVTLPTATLRANQWAAFDSFGNMIAAGAPSGSVPISTPMQPVVDAASTAAALSLLGGTVTVANIGALETLATGVSPVWVDGYNTSGDGGEGLFVVGTTASANGGTIITSGSYTYYRQQTASQVSVKQFGATGNGTTNDYTTVLAADTWAAAAGVPLSYPSGTYLLSSAFTAAAQAVFAPGSAVKSTHSVTFNGGISAPLDSAPFKQITGTLTFAAGTIGSLFPQWWGAVTGGTDCTAALEAAFAALPTNGGKIEFTAGIWSFASPPTLTMPGSNFGLILTGAGASSTVLLFSAGTGIVINGSAPNHTFTITDLGIRSGSAGGGAGTGNGLTLTQSSPGGAIAQNSIERVTFDGSIIGTDYFSDAISVIGWCNVNYISLLVWGNAAVTNGVSLLGNTGTSFKYSIVHNFVACGFYQCAVGIIYGSYVQGVSINQTNFTDGAIGVYVPAAAAGNLSQLIIANSQFAGTGNLISILGPINEIQISNNLLIQGASNTTAIVIDAACVFNTITNNVIPSTSATTTTGIAMIAAVTDSVVIGNVFQGLAVGVTLGAATLRVNVQANHYVNCATTVSNSGTNSIGVATQ